MVFGNENEMNNAAPVPTTSEMKNIMESRRSYLEAHFNSETNVIERLIHSQFDAKKDNARRRDPDTTLGIVWQFGEEVPARVSFTSPEEDSKLRDP
ncbi:hypothetical protein TNCV_2100001 [Trichonephila clavipes]|nr:hypothetical protein TNCV_2100001 [Trichonephila clavipes]